MNSKKLLLIGWDAADWQMIQPLLDNGEMPTLKSLMNKGVVGNISTLQPPLSPMLWTSIATGKRAYDHGILGFAEFNSEKNSVEPIRATKRKSKTFWNILNEAGLKTNVINWWPSHPAEKLNGICISNFYHQGAKEFGKEWPLEDSSVFPENLRPVFEELRLHPGELTLAHIWPFIPEAHNLDPENDAVLKPLIRVLAHCCSIHNAATYAMENSEWDMTAVYYEAIDHFSHLAMKYHPPKQDGIDSKEYDLYKNIMSAAYKFHDMMLERLVSLAGEDCHIMLVSDHGFQSGKQRTVELPDVSAAPALEHRKYGVFLAQGSEFLENSKVYGRTLLDICPTILHFFDLPIGEDMEGKLIEGIWKRKEKPSIIPSWEQTAIRPQFLEDDSNQSNQELLDQLSELGYLKLEDSNKKEILNYELQYNLCQAYLDGNKLKEAIDLSAKLFHKHQDIRSALIHSHSLLREGEYLILEKFLNQLKKKGVYDSSLLFTESQMLMFSGNTDEAMEIFKNLENKGVVSVQLYNEMARAFLIIGVFNEAENFFHKSLELDSENAVALTGIAQCQVERGNFEDAVEFVNRSLEILFFQPNAHYLMGLCLKELGYEKEAIPALKLAINQAPKHFKASALLVSMSRMENEEMGSDKKEIIVVTGLPRSGTSMIMNLLEKGGLEVFHDGKRKSDIHNPKGYFELEDVKSLGVDSSWIPKARNKVIKVVSPLLRYLPSDENYKVIWIKRPLTEVIVSQEIMKGNEKEKVMQNFPFQMAVDMEAEEARIRRWISQQGNIQSVEIQYYDCLKSPELIAQNISLFLGKNLRKEGMFAIDPSLHRNKLGN